MEAAGEPPVTKEGAGVPGDVREVPREHEAPDFQLLLHGGSPPPTTACTGLGSAKRRVRLCSEKPLRG